MTERRAYVPPAIAGPSHLTIEIVRSAAAEILLAIARSRAPHDYDAYVGHWGRMWKLIRASRAARLDFRPHDRGPWAMVVPDTDAPDLQLWLVGGTLRLPIRMPADPDEEDLKNATELSQVLNGAGVQPPER